MTRCSVSRTEVPFLFIFVYQAINAAEIIALTYLTNCSDSSQQLLALRVIALRKVLIVNSSGQNITRLARRMEARDSKRPLSLYVLCLLHLILGVSACAGGAMLMLAPDGSLLGMKNGWLDDSPFQNYFIPGLTLFSLNGIFPIVIFISLLLKPASKFANVLNIFPEMHWAWTYSLYAGVIVILWIIIQLMMTEFFWLQPVIVLLGLLIIVFTMAPGVIRFLELKNKIFIA